MAAPWSCWSKRCRKKFSTPVPTNHPQYNDYLSAIGNTESPTKAKYRYITLYLIAVCTGHRAGRAWPPPCSARASQRAAGDTYARRVVTTAWRNLSRRPAVAGGARGQWLRCGGSRR